MEVRTAKLQTADMFVPADLDLALGIRCLWTRGFAWRIHLCSHCSGLWRTTSRYLALNTCNLYNSIFKATMSLAHLKFLGYIAVLLKLPPMLGMLGLGLFIRNVPYLDFGKHLNPTWSAPIRYGTTANSNLRLI
jgi:hypothetical protein